MAHHNNGHSAASVRSSFLRAARNEIAHREQSANALAQTQIHPRARMSPHTHTYRDTFRHWQHGRLHRRQTVEVDAADGVGEEGLGTVREGSLEELLDESLNGKETGTEEIALEDVRKLDESAIDPVESTIDPVLGIENPIVSVIDPVTSAVDVDIKAIESIVTEIVATVSVIQVVDGIGNTLTLQTLTDDATNSWFSSASAFLEPAPATTLDPELAPITTSEPAAPLPTTEIPLPSSEPPTIVFSSLPILDISTAGPEPSSSEVETASILPSLPPLISDAVSAPLSIPSARASFTSLMINANTSTSVPSSSVVAAVFSNSTIASGRSSLTYLTSASSTDTGTGTDSDSRPTSISTLFESTASSPSSPTGINGVLGLGPNSASGSTPSDRGSSSNGNDPDPSTPSSAVVAGGVVGGLAGAAVIIFILMFLVRWKKRHQSMLLLNDSSGNHSRALADTTRGPPPPSTPQPQPAMRSRPTTLFAVPAALASLADYKRWSQRTETNQTISSTAGSERGFYRVSGRKLPSVLQTGGDGYGGGSDAHTLSGTSFYRDSHGFYGGAGTPPAGLVFPGGSSSSQTQMPSRDSGVPIMRPSPARTPVTEHADWAGLGPVTPPLPLSLPRRPDRLGRSHPSLDGSMASRFMEEV